MLPAALRRRERPLLPCWQVALPSRHVGASEASPHHISALLPRARNPLRASMLPSYPHPAPRGHSDCVVNPREQTPLLDDLATSTAIERRSRGEKRWEPARWWES